jgi:flagellar biosynthetic protein FliR
MSGLPWAQPEWLLGFAVVMVRLVTFLAVLPLFPGSAFGLRMRAIIALWLSWLFQIASPIGVVEVSLAWSVYELTASACIGLVLGFTVRLSLDALHFGGELLGVNIGLGLAGVVDPNTGSRDNPVSRLLVLGGAVAILSMDLHLGILELLRQSFEWQPHVDLWMFGPRAAARMFEEGVRFGLPVIGGATLLYLLFGVLARVAPQVQIFQIAYSVTILGGLLILAKEVGQLPALVESFLQSHLDALARLVR